MTKRIKKPGAKGAGKGKAISKGTDDYEVGYGKPPVHTQFQKGQSGYPTGKPKGTKNRRTIASVTLNKPRQIQVDGKPTKVTTFEALLYKLLANAFAGDNKALLQGIQIGLSLEKAPETDDVAAAVPPIAPETMIALAKDFLAHHDQSSGNGETLDGENK